MEKLEKVEVIREKCGVSYEDAKAALDACDDNVLDAIIWLERQGKSTKQSANYTTESAAQSEVSPEMQAAQTAYQESSKKSDFSENMSSGALRFGCLLLVFSLICVIASKEPILLLLM